MEISDAAGVRNLCLADFYQRFEEAFAREAREFVDAVRKGRPPLLSLRDATEATASPPPWPRPTAAARW